MSDIKYRIISLDENFGSIQVNYYSDDHPLGFTYQIDITLDIHGNPIGMDELNAEIVAREPIWLFNRVQNMKGADLSHIKALIVEMPAPPKAEASQPQPITNAQTV